MREEQQEEEASLYVLGLLPSAEAARMEQRMARDAELCVLVSEMEEAAAALALALPPCTPPATVRAGLLTAMRPHAARLAPYHHSGQWLPWAIAASIAFSAAFLYSEKVRLEREIAALRAKDTLSELRIATLSSQAGLPANAAGSVVWDNGKQKGIVTLEKLPPLAASQDYQLWVIDPQYPQPVNGGIVRVDEKGSARLVFTVDIPIREADKFAISREQRGGVPKAEGPIVMLGQ